MYDELPVTDCHILHRNDDDSPYAPTVFSTNNNTSTFLNDLDNTLTQAIFLANRLLQSNLMRSTFGHNTILRMARTALSRIQEHYTQECIIEEKLPTSGSRLRRASELEMSIANQQLRWKRTSDIVVSPCHGQATWDSSIKDTHWASTRCTSRLHSGTYRLDLQLEHI